MFAPLRDGGRVEVVARRISEAIGLGLIADGEQLPSELELAGALAVSTVTLREALALLRQRGLVETRRGRGGGSFVRAPVDASVERLRTVLRETGVHELREIGDHLLAVTATAARLAAERASDDHIARLADLVDQLEAAETVGERRRADGLFHIEIAAAAQSTRLTRQEIDLQGEIGELLWIPFGEAIERDQRVAQHRALIAAIADGDGDLARRLTEENVELAISRLIEFHLQLTQR
ncbi:GntR family transcriptional regulator [Prauserella coralliicola]|uniref:FadR family transcriptional regulator n=1 Tax=Prauserella endophytica TaxID=1592324 RepID=A0ABY2SBP1_9PSEU|nr:GntR family transcriptional regulator [Prauserella coralliicola]TKG72405.1 FadR family transcriptional regulator [Prauserella endophytica]